MADELPGKVAGNADREAAGAVEKANLLGGGSAVHVGGGPAPSAPAWTDTPLMRRVGNHKRTCTAITFVCLVLVILVAGKAKSQPPPDPDLTAPELTDTNQDEGVPTPGSEEEKQLELGDHEEQQLFTELLDPQEGAGNASLPCDAVRLGTDTATERGVNNQLTGLTFFPTGVVCETAQRQCGVRDSRRRLRLGLRLP